MAPRCRTIPLTVLSAVAKLKQPSPSETQANNDDTINTIIKVFLIVGCVLQGWLILPLAWCIPITVSIFNSLRNKTPINTEMKVCALLFVNFVCRNLPVMY